MTAILIRTSTGWENLAVQGPQGPTGPQGIQGIQGIQGPQGPAGPTDEEGSGDFSVTGADYTIPSGAWGTPGWFAPIIVGPNQTWEIEAWSAIRCVTAVGVMSYRSAIRDSAGGLSYPAGVSLPATYLAFQPVAINLNIGVICSPKRLTTDATVPAGTTLRIVQEFNGGNANGRALRDGNQYGAKAFRRI